MACPRGPLERIVRLRPNPRSEDHRSRSVRRPEPRAKSSRKHPWPGDRGGAARRVGEVTGRHERSVPQQPAMRVGMLGAERKARSLHGHKTATSLERNEARARAISVRFCLLDATHLRTRPRPPISRGDICRLTRRALTDRPQTERRIHATGCLHYAERKPAPESNDALSGCGPTEIQETRWILPAVRLNA
jgi:hypothetical protein